MNPDQSAKNNLSWREAITEVLKTAQLPMDASAIVAAIRERGLRAVTGDTPEATVGANIYSSMKRDGDASPFEQTAPGEFKVRHPSGGAASAVKSTEDDEEEPKKSARIIHAFGMYWQRDRVKWKSHPRLLGRPNKTPPNSEVVAVDFCNQRGVYFLHDGSEVVYVGRALERPLGVRLSEHVDDRLNGRWNRFSWFGLLRISDGKVVEDSLANPTANGSEIIIVMESLLIEGLEPKQNRKRGDSAFQAVEYIQSDDEVAREKERMDLIRQLLAPKPND